MPIQPVFHLRTVAEVACCLGLSPATVARWPAKYPDANLGRQGEWDALAFARLALRIRGLDDGGEVEGGEPLKVQRLKAEIEKLREEAKGKRLRNEATEGDLIDRSELEQSVAEVFAMIRTRLESVPDEFEMRFPAETRAENKSDMSDLVRKVLKEMSEWQPPAALAYEEESTGDEY